jgi:hypothetical protein
MKVLESFCKRKTGGKMKKLKTWYAGYTSKINVSKSDCKRIKTIHNSLTAVHFSLEMFSDATPTTVFFVTGDGESCYVRIRLNCHCYF